MEKNLLIIPALNEEKSIEQVIVELKKFNYPIDIILVSDGSTDRTVKKAKEAGLEVIALPYNLGYGAALQTGFKYACARGYERVIQFDADGQHDPSDISKLLDIMDGENVDIVVGSRFLGKGDFRTGFMKRTAIILFRWIIFMATKVRITDPSSGLQGLRREVFKYYAMMGNFPYDYPDADILIGMILRGFKVKEFPANIRVRSQGVSMHSGLRPAYYIFKMLISILVIIIRSKSTMEAKQ